MGIHTLQRLVKKYEEEDGNISSEFYDSWEIRPKDSCDDPSDVDATETDAGIETSREDASNKET